MFAGIGAIIGTVGKILATAHLIASSIRAVIALVRYVPQLARDLRAGYGNYSVPMAQMNMSVRMAEIMDQMKIANNRGVVSSFANMSKAQVEFITMSRPLRTAFAQAVGNIGAQMYSFGGAAATFMSGLMGFDMQAILAGLGGMQGYGLLGTAAPGGFVGKMLYDAYVAQQMAGQRATFAGQFEADLNVMTGGRFSTSSAYTSKAANKRNWWDYRP
jgi:hypothetical protein